ncbi:MAG: glycosyltransferase family 4 protein [Patescibacteria group bacterium]
MKILTNIRFYNVAGIAQSLSQFIAYIGHSRKNMRVIGVDIQRPGEARDDKRAFALKDSHFSLRHRTIDFIGIGDAIKQSHTLEDIKKLYEPIIAAYEQAIIKEQPDLVLLNGTYFLPWCLLQAANRQHKKTVLHYHGLLTKETENWFDHARNIFGAMERSFDRDDMHYIFPSQLARQAVEADVFGHTIKHATIIPNPVPMHFFTKPRALKKKRKKDIGLVSRWTKIKNPQFFASLAHHNKRHWDDMRFTSVTDLPTRHIVKTKFRNVITFQPAVSNKNLAAFYRSMDVIISPSHFETYGNVAQEAVASGTPALISANMGVAETFKSLGLEHLIVSFDSVASVHRKIREISNQGIDPEVQYQMREMLNPSVLHEKLYTTIRKV